MQALCRRLAAAIARHKILWLILAVSCGLRIVLAVSGGQRFFSDEGRYVRSFQLLAHLSARDVRGAGRDILQGADHTGFTVVGAVPAAAQSAAVFLRGVSKKRSMRQTANTDPGLQDVHDAYKASLEDTYWLGAVVLSLASVAVIGMTYLVARRAGADEPEAVIAALLISGCATMTYYSRHFFPYDASLALGLAALYVGMAPGSSFKTSLFCGLTASCAFLTYNGYWLIALAAMGVHVLAALPNFPAAVRRGVGAAAGFVAIPALLTGVTVVCGLKPYVVAMIEFSRTIKQGDPSEGWSLVWAYLWYSEHGMLLVFALAAAIIAWSAVRRRPALPGRAFCWLAIVAGMYLLLVVLSTGFGRFVVYGRLVRQMAPLMCLMTACVLWAGPLAGWLTKKWLSGGLLLLFLVQAGVNLTPLFMQRFPRDVNRQWTAKYGPLTHAISLVGPPSEYAPYSSVGEEQKRRYLLLNAQSLFPVFGVAPPVAGNTIDKTRHPVEYLPVQYDGYDPKARAILRSTDVSMRLIDTLTAGNGH